MIMRLPHFRVRSLMLAVAVVAFLIWGGMMASKSFVYYQRASEYGEKERGWRRIADRPDLAGGPEFRLECVDYFAMLAAKYRHAMWHPWSPVAPDPHAPGFDQWLEQEIRAKRILTDPLSPGTSSAPK
jgi:hypothetical protein